LVFHTSAKFTSLYKCFALTNEKYCKPKFLHYGQHVAELPSNSALGQRLETGSKLA